MSLEQQVIQVQERLHQRQDFLRVVFDEVPYVVFAYAVAENGELRAIRMNKTGSKLTGLPVEHWTGKTPEQIHPPDAAADIRGRLEDAIDQRHPVFFEEEIDFPNGKIWTQSIYTPVADKKGRVYRVVGTAVDITERKKHALHELEKREAIIQQQSNMLTELSTPLLAISNNVVVMPLIGTIDPKRAQQIMEGLLVGVSAMHASVVIIDITGVTVVDTQVANTLVHAAQAVNLLGARVALTGIRPEIAQTLVNLGVNLGSISTYSTLQAGIASALRQ